MKEIRMKKISGDKIMKMYKVKIKKIEQAQKIRNNFQKGERKGTENIFKKNW